MTMLILRQTPGAVEAVSGAQPAVFTSAAAQTQKVALALQQEQEEARAAMAQFVAAHEVAPAVVMPWKDSASLVAAWMDELEASAPPPNQLAFAIHMRRQAARLVELLGG